jgi:hypothetical protein
MFDDSSYPHNEGSVSCAPPPTPTKNLNDNEANVAFMQHFIPFIDPDTANLFDPSQCPENTLKYIILKVR